MLRKDAVAQPVGRDTLALTGDLAPAQPAGKSELRFDPESSRYNYVWKTDKAWAGACRARTIKLIGDTQHLAYFQFKRPWPVVRKRARRAA